jgi:hypothetical protein
MLNYTLIEVNNRMISHLIHINHGFLHLSLGNVKILVKS